MWAVKFEGVTKRYRRDRLKYRSLRSDLTNLARRVTFSPQRVARDEIEALSNIDLEIEAGTSSAIVGRNGAGKSTALRLISRITYPTEGRVRVRGRVGALIEIGAGVHPELSGRENIWLYGSFLGISRADIRRQFDHIVEFAEIEQAVDMPVKFYSTGMSLRLGFAIASYLEPAIFIVDESLAVGDGNFQAKCIRRMQELGSEGTTIVFVSHELAAVEALCDHAIWLDHGRVRDQGPIGHILRSYSRSLDEGLRVEPGGSEALRCLRAITRSPLGAATSTFGVGDPLSLRLEFEGAEAIEQPQVSIRITDGQWEDLIECTSPAGTSSTTGTRWAAECCIESLPLNPRMYQVWCSVSSGTPAQRRMDWCEVGAFRIRANRGKAMRTASIAGPPVAIDSTWRLGP
ncbi:MAG: polysaccharide ABC transporter ATP-binding protein [Acidimicrobiia bacterium]|nr:polysaccharide ABC transporter ATP-binding protein [Acidimicrobiia bacterium]